MSLASLLKDLTPPPSPVNECTEEQTTRQREEIARARLHKLGIPPCGGATISKKQAAAARVFMCMSSSRRCILEAQLARMQDFLSFRDKQRTRRQWQRYQATVQQARLDRNLPTHNVPLIGQRPAENWEEYEVFESSKLSNLKEVQQQRLEESAHLQHIYEQQSVKNEIEYLQRKIEDQNAILEWIRYESENFFAGTIELPVSRRRKQSRREKTIKRVLPRQQSARKPASKPRKDFKKS